LTALLAGAARRNLIELRRYGFDTVFNLGGILLLFLLMFYGARGLAGPSINNGQTLTALVAGFITFGLVVQSYASIASWTTQEATLGTLEQLAMSPFGLTRVLLSEFAASFAYQLVVVTVMSTVVQAATGRWLRLDVLSIIPIIIPLLLQVLGCGLLLGGLALVFKRVTAVANLMQFAFVAVIAAPVHTYTWMRWLPVALASDLLRQATASDHPAGHVGADTWGTLIVVTVAWLVVGLLVFRRMDRLARDRGLIGLH
jgi:ABC-2 type transport system permease protein